MQCFVVIKIQDWCIVCPPMLPTARVRLIFARHEMKQWLWSMSRCSFPASKRGRLNRSQSSEPWLWNPSEVLLAGLDQDCPFNRFNGSRLL